MMTNQLAKGADFREQLLLLLTEIEAVLAEIEDRLAGETRINELGQLINEEYKELGEKLEDRTQEKMSQLAERIRPLQEEIDSRYQRFAGTKYQVGRFIRHLRDTLNRAPTVPSEIRDLRAEIERLDLLKGGPQAPEWRRAQTDVLTVRGRLEEVLEFLSAAVGHPAPEAQETGSTAEAPSAPPRQRRGWAENAERDQIIRNCLARGTERRQICEELDRRTIPTLRGMQGKGIFKWALAWNHRDLRKNVQQLFSKVASREKLVKSPPVSR